MTQRERHFAGEAYDVVEGLAVSADASGGVAHSGSIGVRMLAERTGQTKELLVEVAVTLADAGEAIADINVLRHQGQVLGPVT